MPIAIPARGVCGNPFARGIGAGIMELAGGARREEMAMGHVRFTRQRTADISTRGTLVLILMGLAVLIGGLAMAGEFSCRKAGQTPPSHGQPSRSPH